MSVLTYLDASTLHVTPTVLDGPRHHCIADYPEGAIFYVPEEIDDDCPADLAGVLVFARQLGCNLVRLDCDAPVVVGLPTFGEAWEVVS